MDKEEFKEMLAELFRSGEIKIEPTYKNGPSNRQIPCIAVIIDGDYVAFFEG